MIPKTIHFIWIGPNRLPEEWVRTWKEKNDKIEIVFWDEKKIDEFGLVDRKQYDFYYSRKIWNGSSDIARVEILERLGGIYMDCDSICLEPIQDEKFMETDFFVCYEHMNHPGRIANGVIASVAGHPILKEYIKRMGEAEKLTPPWNTIGGTMLTKIIEDYGKEKITILPTCSFWPTNHNGQKAPLISKVYAEQMWGTTRHLYKQLDK
jgi:mannosyltransferase OCH1-like enzyme